MGFLTREFLGNGLEQQWRYWPKRMVHFSCLPREFWKRFASIGEGKDVQVPNFYYKIIAKAMVRDLKIIAFPFSAQGDIGRLVNLWSRLMKLEEKDKEFDYLS